MHELFQYISEVPSMPRLTKTARRNIEQLVDAEIDSLSTLMILLASFEAQTRLQHTRKSKRDSTARGCVFYAVTRTSRISTSGNNIEDGIFSSPFIFVALHNTRYEGITQQKLS